LNIAEQMEFALAPVWIVDLCNIHGTSMGPGQLIPVRDIDSVRIVGGTVPVWEWARRVIEGADA
jgi:hypothetical protein